MCCLFGVGRTENGSGSIGLGPARGSAKGRSNRSSRANTPGVADGWQGVQPEETWHWRRPRAPRTPQAKYHRADRGKWVPFDGPKIDCPARPAARAAGRMDVIVTKTTAVSRISWLSKPRPPCQSPGRHRKFHPASRCGPQYCMLPRRPGSSHRVVPSMRPDPESSLVVRPPPSHASHRRETHQ
jgi:hypothetical protein